MEKGQTMSEALSEAQKLGIAEADPKGDLSGMDAAVKVRRRSRLQQPPLPCMHAVHCALSWLRPTLILVPSIVAGRCPVRGVSARRTGRSAQRSHRLWDGGGDFGASAQHAIKRPEAASRRRRGGVSRRRPRDRARHA
eukprot:6185488-Pleurochrysis_carterae.AAC.5